PDGSDAELLARAVTGVRLLAEGLFQEGQRLVTAAFGELGDPRTSGRGPQTLSLLASAAVSVGADEGGLACAETALRRWRRRGATGRLPRAMLTRAASLFHSGQVAAAVATARRARELAAELGQRHVVELIDHWSLLPAAVRGDVDDYDTLVRGLEPADRPGIAPVPTRFTAEVGILLDLARRRYGTALWRCE